MIISLSHRITESSSYESQSHRSQELFGANMTFDLKRVAFASFKNKAFDDAFPPGIVFMLNALAQSFGQRIKGKTLDSVSLDKLARIYHQLTAPHLPYQTQFKGIFIKKISGANPAEIDQIFGNIFIQHLRNQKKLKAFKASENDIVVNTMALAADFGVKIELWGYDENVKGSDELTHLKDHDRPEAVKCPLDAKTLKILISQQDSEQNKEPYAFEFDAGWLPAGTKEQGIAAKIEEHNGFYQAEKAKFDALKGKKRAEESKASQESAEETKAVEERVAAERRAKEALEQQRAAAERSAREAKAADERRAAEQRAKEALEQQRAAAERSAKEAKAAEESRAREAKIAEERRAREAKSAEEKCGAETKASADFFVGGRKSTGAAPEEFHPGDSKRASDRPFSDCDPAGHGLGLGGLRSSARPGVSADPSSGARASASAYPSATSTPGSSTASSLGSSGLSGSSGSSGSSASTATLPQQTVFTNLFQAIAGDSENEWRNQETGSFTIKGLLLVLIAGVAEFFSIFTKFGHDAGEAYKAAHSGRPLDPEEIKDKQDALFNHSVLALPKEQRLVQERLNSRWRIAAKGGDVAAKKQIFEDLKDALVNANNAEAFDNLRFEEFLEKIKNPYAKDNIRRQKLNKNANQTWGILLDQLLIEGAYVEANEILQGECRKQGQELSENKEYQDCNLVAAYQQALNHLSRLDITQTSPDQQKQRCEIRLGMLNHIITLNSQLAYLDKLLNETLQKVQKSGHDVKTANALCEKHKKLTEDGKAFLKQKTIKLLEGDWQYFVNPDVYKRQEKQREHEEDLRKGNAFFMSPESRFMRPESRSFRTPPATPKTPRTPKMPRTPGTPKTPFTPEGTPSKHSKRKAKSPEKSKKRARHPV